MAKTILVVDDDPTQRRLIQAVLERDGNAVVHAASGGEAIDRMTRGGGADLILLDMVMPEMSGLECLAELRSAGINEPVIVLTANGGIDMVVKAMQAGAQDFFVKPVGPERLLVGVRNAMQMKRLTAEVGRLTKRVQGRTSFDDIVGDSPPMRMVKALGARAAKSSIPVLITGESGVGKEVIARALHGASDRAGKPFVAVNCGALPANLIESILFGHEKGAFTGAVDKTLGKFREADGGTLFLDEIGELPLDMQVKLLRALQEGEIDPVGGKRPVKIDVRIVSATNRDPAQQVKDGAFREDLFYRLNVFPIEAPSLRDRREDIAPLVDHFIARFNAEEGKRIAGCAPETLALLQGFDWPGNVRQLENAVFRAIVLADAPFLQPHDFPAISGVAAPMPDAQPLQVATAAGAQTDAAAQVDQPIRILDERGHLRTLEDIERDLIQHAIEVYAGHMSEIARRLGIGRSTLYRKVREQGLEGQLKEAG
ncbi:MAG: DNA-binding NtrC family response regulator [Brevundimonas sp.]|jgi:DNA-binding NtrC family response regulator|uniref:DNA-binding transcriptional regulator NtrC n=1 Tax=Brevundimonas vesicularis TaxID=41276 RepID=A0A1Z3UB06_BREVE|nr:MULTISPECIES: sigma-54 dependent transcriptional regulator [Brevundimonas]ANC53798.1 sigma-54-dependent Fis family transcriptional regulator [Brevundimonas sp. GW460-12-10-14-LB2]ASE40421.1 sigma-54-dependent Fis family transcriptional regulator [Brevundimonas vesicularis]MDX2334767.1 sigma-54 dependent transcriptional regulator [Brevundimonas vesicularis]MEA3472967.1 sigma-54 dependent transcriptional regulator [Pseudomonadota bacterium]